MELPEAVKSEYLKIAKGCNGTSGEILSELMAFARREARTLIGSGVAKAQVADAFEELAKQCYQQACDEKWFNDYAVGISDQVRKAVMSIPRGRG